MDINKRSHVPYRSLSSRGPPIIDEGDKRSYYQIIKKIKSGFIKFLFDTAFQLSIHTFSSNPENRRQSGNPG